MTGGIYVISKTKHAERWRNLRASGRPIVSTWIDRQGETVSIDLFRSCLAEISLSDVAVAYRAWNDAPLKDGMWELAAAHHFGVPIFAFGINLNGLFNSREFDDTEDMWRAADRQCDLACRYRASIGLASVCKRPQDISAGDAQ